MLGITIWSILILLRLVQLQVFKHNTYTEQAAEGQQVSRSIRAKRGIIYDIHMNELATSVYVPTAVAEPRRIEDKSSAAQNLAEILDLDPQKLLKGMTDPNRRYYLVIKRRIDPKKAEDIRSLDIDGIYFVDEGMRAYPNRDLASHTLGFVNREGNGGAGIELKYDRILKGREGQYSLDVDARRKSFNVKVETPPVQGHSLVLSIDKDFQHIAERALEAGIERARAKAGTALVMESETGRMLALANYPDFNCNKYNEYGAEFWKNRSVSDMYEPGSTFKVVVAAAALDSGLTKPDELIDCQMGSIAVGRHIFHDHKSYGLLTFKEVLEFSSNVGAVKLGQRLGEPQLYDALRNFGFGSKSGIDLPGEIVGLVRDWRDWSGLSIGAISFGQEVGVTSIQMAIAINAIANGGYRVRPSVVDRIIDEKGDLVEVHTPERVRIMSARTAQTVSEAFEGVVLRGTGRRAALEGYRAAGKTGTAQKSIGGRYADGKYVASFIGFAPLPNPKITILVQIDEPRGMHYGGEVCGPVFKEIAQQILMQLRIPPDQDLPLPALAAQVAGKDSMDFLPYTAAVQTLELPGSSDPVAKKQPESISVKVGEDWVVLPDFKGLSKRSVLNRCMDLGIRLKSVGSGIAVYQSPLPGEKISPGATCEVTFAKVNPKEAAEARYTAQGNNPYLPESNRP
jgi:cell division protein FtsI (penicillin-binding protein 3)